MKRTRLFLLMTFLALAGTGFAQNIRILMVIPEYYGLNSNLYREKFIEFGWDIDVAAIDSVVHPCPWSVGLGSKPMDIDLLIDSIQDVTLYDAIIIAQMNWRYQPANPYGDLTGSSHFLDLLRQANNAHIVIMTSCAGTLVLAAADIINGKTVQGTPGTNNQYADIYIAAGANYAGSNLPPVTDGNLVTTTRGQYFMKQNCDAVMVAMANNN